jgi:hypothetical protein
MGLLNFILQNLCCLSDNNETETIDTPTAEVPNIRARIPGEYETLGRRFSAPPDTKWKIHETTRVKGFYGQRQDLYYDAEMDGRRKGYPHLRNVYYGSEPFSWAPR